MSGLEATAAIREKEKKTGAPVPILAMTAPRLISLHQHMRSLIIFCLILAASAPAAERPARNVVLFLGDGTGPATINAASIYGYSQPRQLFLQNMPHIGLSETSAASSWVSDSAAGMTAIVTGQKTHNGVISQSAAAVRGVKDGEPLKTILEYAEERGLSTGVVSNSSMADATPAACYAHSNDRRKTGEIFAQVLTPRFGDGVDVIIGPGRLIILKATRELGLDLETALPKKGFRVLDSLEAVPPDARRVVLLFPDAKFDLEVKVEGSHTAEEVLVAAQGPGAGRVRGIFPNTELFHIMMAAYGWREKTQAPAKVTRQPAGDPGSVPSSRPSTSSSPPNRPAPP